MRAMRACRRWLCCAPYHLHLVPPPGAHKISPRAPGERGSVLILSCQLLDPHLRTTRLELTFWSVRAIGQPPSPFPGICPKKQASALPPFLELSSLATRLWQQL